MSYVVRVVWPDGVARYLWRGRMVDYANAATQFPHPSNAWRAAGAYWTRNPACYVGVVDCKDPERVVSE